MDQQRFQQLLDNYISGRLTPDESRLLGEMIEMPEYRETLNAELKETFFSDAFLDKESETRKNKIDTIIFKKIRESETNNSTTKQVHRIHFLRTTWFRYAASILLILTSITFVYLWNQKTETGALTQEIRKKHDVAAPATVRASLTLSDGMVVYLDSAATGTLAVQGNVQIKKRGDGSVEYEGAGKGKMLYNTLTVPRGSKIASITLSDGSLVYLNTASSLRYPVAFTGNERRVEITGEAYFEVAQDPHKKFVVQAGEMRTEVLGTHFNVNSYQEDATKKVTLVEGKVRVFTASEDVLLSPGQQAQLDNNLALVDKINVENIVAWKNGKFRFANTGIEEVMKQFERWYNITVEYHAKPAKTFSGGIPRSVSVLSALKILEATGGVRFNIEGNKVIVMK